MHERREVGQAHSTEDAHEQSARCAARGGGGGGKGGLTKGNFGRAKQAPDTEPGRKGAKHGKL